MNENESSDATRGDQFAPPPPPPSSPSSSAPPPPSAEFDLSEPQYAVSAPNPVAAQAQAPVLGRRPSVQRFSAPPLDQSTPLVRRDLLRSGRKPSEPEIGRQRKIAGNLPAWEPTPPGEVLQASRNA